MRDNFIAQRLKELKVQDNFTKQVRDFLVSHPFISVAAIEKYIDMPATTLAQIKNRNVPIKYKFDLICILIEYGFKYDSFNWHKDGPGLFGKKLNFIESEKTDELNVYRTIYEEIRHIISDDLFD